MEVCSSTATDYSLLSELLQGNIWSFFLAISCICTHTHTHSGHDTCQLTATSLSCRVFTHSVIPLTEEHQPVLSTKLHSRRRCKYHHRIVKLKGRVLEPYGQCRCQECLCPWEDSQVLVLHIHVNTCTFSQSVHMPSCYHVMAEHISNMDRDNFLEYFVFLIAFR